MTTTEQGSHRENRSGEIWSTRIQQELLALTTDNADMESTEARSMLPAFTTVKDHTLDIAAGTCVVSVQVDVVTASSKKEEKEGQEEEDAATEAVPVVFSMEASLAKNEDGSVNAEASSYPFSPPVARLTSGKAVFPVGSTIDDGDRISMDLDWTPSLHLTDAILNIGLKIRESILQAEPFHPEPEPDPFDEAIDEVAKGAKRFAANLTKKVGEAFTPKANSGTPKSRNSNSSGKKKKRQAVQTPGDVTIGDEINVLEEPWTFAHGVYSCKAIRRPEFVEEIIAKSSKKDEQLSSPTAMFRSFAQSARSVMEESFLMVTDTHIIEMKAHRLNGQMGTVTFCIPIEMMAKLKFRRKESLSLFFKAAPDDPLIYMCPDSGDAVHQIQSVLKSKGVRGKHTNAAAYRAINQALLMVQDIQSKEIALDHEPSLERVNEIMDLYRQAAELFSDAGDIRHEEVVTHMRKFLAKPDVVRILDEKKESEKASPASSQKAAEVVSQVKVVETAPSTPVEKTQEPDEQSSTPKNSPAAKDDEAKDGKKEFDIDNLLKDAKEDFGEFNLDDDVDSVEEDGAAGETAVDGIEDMAADLDAMMKEADKELAELMGS